MTQDTNDLLTPEGTPAKLSTGLNILTILTFIGSAWELYSVVNNFIGGKKALAEFEKAQEKLAEAPAWAKKMASPQVYEVMQKALENKVPLFITGLVAVALCVYGAIEMRKLKKQGYLLWLIGELLPVISAVIFIGSVYFNTFLVYFNIFPAIFILLYTLQRKYLVR